MSAFRRVAGDEAGPNALGILVPPGRRTLVVLRPRALACDLVPLQSPGTNGGAPGFAEVDHKDAPGLSHRLFRALEAWADGSGTGAVEHGPAVGAEGFGIVVRLGSFQLVACTRVPGQPYRPLVCGSLEEARALAEQLREVLFPPAGTTQELYFNTKNFSR